MASRFRISIQINRLWTLILLRIIKSTHQRRARILPVVGFGDAVAEAWSGICLTGRSMRSSAVHRLEVS
jgi:hypothetical protein